MKPSTKLLLYELAQLLTCVARPTYSNLNQSFEGWAHSKGLLRCIHRLEAEQFLRTQGRSLERVIALTEKAHRLLASEDDPEKAWARPWDGVWRFIIFDVPEKERRVRDSLRKALRQHRCGLLQKSVWVSPDPLQRLPALIRDKSGAAKSLTVLESRVIDKSEDSEIVRLSWNFERTNEQYTSHMEFLDRWEKAGPEGGPSMRVRDEKRLWDQALSADPLLPSVLLPPRYFGKRAFRKRRALLPKLIQRDINHG